MKKTMLTLVLVGLSAAATYAQGTIQFLNSTLSAVKYQEAPGATIVNAPVGCVIGVFYGSSGANLAQNTDGTPIITPGVFNAGTQYALPGAPAGSPVFLKIAGWNTSGGTTPLRAAQGRATPGITHYGESAVVQTANLADVGVPGTVVWQSASGTSLLRAKPFVIELVPEPSVVALGALGLGALLLRRRKA